MSKIKNFFKNDKVKNFFRGIYFALAVSQLEKVADMLKGHWSGTFVNDRIQDLNIIAEIITDRDPENVKQLKQYLDENRERLLDGAIQTAINLVNTSKLDQDVKEGVVRALEEIKAIQVFEQAELPFPGTPDENAGIAHFGVTPMAGDNGAVAQVI